MKVVIPFLIHVLERMRKRMIPDDPMYLVCPSYCKGSLLRSNKTNLDTPVRYVIGDFQVLVTGSCNGKHGDIEPTEEASRREVLEEFGIYMKNLIRVENGTIELGSEKKKKMELFCVSVGNSTIDTNPPNFKHSESPSISTSKIGCFITVPKSRLPLLYQRRRRGKIEERTQTGYVCALVPIETMLESLKKEL